MDARVLGSICLYSTNGMGVPRAPKQRQCLAMLVLQANRLVSNGALFEELWGNEPPRTCVTTLQTYIGQLRRFIAAISGHSLEAVMERVLTTEPGGYVLHLEPERVDSRRFEELAARGRTALASDSLQEAASMFDSALKMWTGGALENVQHGPLLASQIRRLDVLRLAVAQQRYDVDLRLGKHFEIVGDLIELAAQHPLDEGIHALLMRALAQSGRRFEALQVFMAMRKRLVDELGLSPSPEMSTLQQAILSNDLFAEHPAERS